MANAINTGLLTSRCSISFPKEQEFTNNSKADASREETCYYDMLMSKHANYLKAFVIGIDAKDSEQWYFTHSLSFAELRRDLREGKITNKDYEHIVQYVTKANKVYLKNREKYVDTTLRGLFPTVVIDEKMVRQFVSSYNFSNK